MHYSNQWTSSMKNKAPDDANELLLRLYALSKEQPIEHFQNAALMLLKPVVAFDAGIWGAATICTNGIDIHSFHLYDKTPDMVADYEEVKHLDTASSGMFDQAQATRAFHTNSFFEGHAKRPIRDFMTKYEQPHFLLSTELKAQTSSTSTVLNWITLYRTKQNAHYSPADVGRLQMFAPHFTQALSLNRILHLGKVAESGKRNRNETLHATGMADLKGNLYGHDANFMALVSKASGEDYANTTHLPANLIAKLKQGKKTFVWQHLIVRLHVEHGLIIIKLREQTLADALTPREKQIALLIAQGRTYKQVASTLGRATGTVRNQIQTIYGKLCVNNIAELIAALQDLKESFAD